MHNTFHCEDLVTRDKACNDEHLLYNLFHTYSTLCQSSCEGGGYPYVPLSLGYHGDDLSHNSAIGEQALSLAHRTSGVDITCSDTQCQYLLNDNNQLTDKLTNHAFNPYAQSNVQKSQCGFNNYSWQEHNGGPYYYNGDSVQEGNVCFDAILDSICVFDSDSVNAGTVVYQVVDLVNIYNEVNDSLQQFLYVHPTSGNACVGFCHFQCVDLTVTHIVKCCQVPSGQLNVVGSGLVPIHMVEIYKEVADSSGNPRVTHDNYLQDCLTFDRHGILYNEYICNIIDNMIEKSNHADQTDRANDSVSFLFHDGDASIKCQDTCPVPNGIGGHLTNNDLDSDLSVSHDFDIADKVRGFLNHSSGEFSFIGPDRDIVTISTISQCFQIAEVIRDTGLPNYRQSRIPLSSGLNLQAWEYRLRDYPDKFLIQYLKFGFPLSLTNPTSLHNVGISNHPSALAYPEAVDEYISKEVALGAMLGPSDHKNDHYHCSPLLTRPKDTDKRRVILNLSYPYGASVNDCVSKSHFDGRRFTPKFPMIDDIIQDILQTDDPVIFKVDVARAFRNLRVDPVDAVKFGISWEGRSYVDLSVAFGWTHGSASFQMASDAIVFIMKGMGCKVHAYIDDYVIVAPRGLAFEHFPLICCGLSPTPSNN